jgi:hypothetical protein
VGELQSVVDHEGAVIGVLLTAQDLLGGKGIDCPPLRHTSQTFKKAPKAGARTKASTLFEE